MYLNHSIMPVNCFLCDGMLSSSNYNNNTDQDDTLVGASSVGKEGKNLEKDVEIDNILRGIQSLRSKKAGFNVAGPKCHLDCLVDDLLAQSNAMKNDRLLKVSPGQVSESRFSSVVLNKVRKQTQMSFENYSNQLKAALTNITTQARDHYFKAVVLEDQESSRSKFMNFMNSLLVGRAYYMLNVPSLTFDRLFGSKVMPTYWGQVVSQVFVRILVEKMMPCLSNNIDRFDVSPKSKNIALQVHLVAFIAMYFSEWQTLSDEDALNHFDRARFCMVFSLMIVAFGYICSCMSSGYDVITGKAEELDKMRRQMSGMQSMIHDLSDAIKLVEKNKTVILGEL